MKLSIEEFNYLYNWVNWEILKICTARMLHARLFSVVTVIDAVSAAILPVRVDYTSLKGLPCAPGPATTRRGMLVTNG